MPKYEEPYEREVARLIIHGCLHLIGYLDKKKSKNYEWDENYFLNKINWLNLFQNGM